LDIQVCRKLQMPGVVYQRRTGVACHDSNLASRYSRRWPISMCLLRLTAIMAKRSRRRLLAKRETAAMVSLEKTVVPIFANAGQKSTRH